METTTILRATSYFGGHCLVSFSETGFEVIEDTRDYKDGYLHIFENSATAITDACRNQIIKYFYNHRSFDVNSPGIGATPQHQYFSNLSIEEMENIGNNNKKCFYR